MNRSFLIPALCALLIISVAGCASARRGEPIAGPLESGSPHILNGQQAFMEHCQQCHPGGESGLGPALNDKPLPVFLMKYQVRKGIGAMPAFDKTTITGAELDDLMAYVKILRNHG